MELINTFSVSQPVDRAWEVITDLERVAPCLPGAALLGVEGEDYRGAVKIKVGPVTAQYEGVARFIERDDTAHRAVLRAEGRDVRGQGNAAATIDLSLTAQGAGTQVSIATDLELAGRVAQFGRGVISDVSGKLIGQFATRLEEEMAGSGSPAPTPGPAAKSQAPTVSAAPARRSIDDVEPLDLMSAGGTAALKQAVPAAAAVLGLLFGWLLGRRRGSGGRAPVPAQIVLNLMLPGHDTPGTTITEGNR
jgi:carbon monoxide dehydrogenase subunit G